MAFLKDHTCINLVKFWMIVLLVATNVSAAKSQSIKKATSQNLHAYEEFHVLASNENTRQGTYLRLTSTKADTLAFGAYDNNEKDGYWKYFDYGTLIATGEYKHGQKTGIWNYFDNGEPALQYDHTHQSVEFVKPNNHLCELKTGLCFAKSVLSSSPEYPGLCHLLHEKVVYPLSALRMGVTGKVIVSFVVDIDGTASQFKIQTDIGSGCGEALLAALSTFDRQWIPATLHESKVPVRVLIQADFQLMENGENRITLKKL